MLKAIKTKPYRLKHEKTGLYYQPYEYKGCNLSERGKKYFSKINILTVLHKKGESLVPVYCHKDAPILKKIHDLFDWKETVKHKMLETFTKQEEWVKEYTRL